MANFELFSKRVDIDKIFKNLSIARKEAFVIKYPHHKTPIPFYEVFYDESEDLGYVCLLPDSTELNTFKFCLKSVEEIKREMRLLKLNPDIIKYPKPLEMKITETE